MADVILDFSTTQKKTFGKGLSKEH